MTYYLVDTCAFIYAVECLYKTKPDIFFEKGIGLAFLYMPQFCVTEVFNTLARLRFRDNVITEAEYNKNREKFIEMIQNRRTIYCYDLHRYHNLNTQKIYEIEHKSELNTKENHLSALDILIIAMGMELKKIHEKEPVKILTRDGRIQTISKLLREKHGKDEFAEAIWLREAKPRKKSKQKK